MKVGSKISNESLNRNVDQLYYDWSFQWAFTNKLFESLCETFPKALKTLNKQKSCGNELFESLIIFKLRSHDQAQSSFIFLCLSIFKIFLQFNLFCPVPWFPAKTHPERVNSNSRLWSSFCSIPLTSFVEKSLISYMTRLSKQPFGLCKL